MVYASRASSFFRSSTLRTGTVGGATSPIGQPRTVASPPASRAGYSMASSFEPARRPAPVVLTPAAADSQPQRSTNPSSRSPSRVTVPTARTHSAVPSDEAQRTPALARRQEQLIANSRGQPVLFTNANGRTEALRFAHTRAGIRVTDAHRNSFVVQPRPGLTQAQLLQGAAAFADHWTQYPPHLRDSAPIINLHPGNRRATYTNTVGGVLDLGMDDLDEMTFDHEFGHAVGYAERRNHGTPAGWERAIQANGVAPSRYANRNTREDFAESWLAYVEARERGPAHVEALRRQFPNRIGIVERVYSGGARS